MFQDIIQHRFVEGHIEERVGGVMPVEVVWLHTKKKRPAKRGATDFLTYLVDRIKPRQIDIVLLDLQAQG